MEKLLYPDTNTILRRISLLERQEEDIKYNYFKDLKWVVKFYQTAECEIANEEMPDWIDDISWKELQDDKLERRKILIKKHLAKKPEAVAEIKKIEKEIVFLYKLLKHNYHMHMEWDV